MKCPLLALLAVVSTCWSASAQSLMLNTGDSYVFDFNGFSFLGTYRFSPAPTTVALPTLSGSGTMRLEVFENSVGEAPVFSATSDSLSSPINLGTGGWQDLQGVIRITELSGSTTLNGSFFAQVTIPSVNSPPYYEVDFQSVPVPEPEWFGFGMLAAAASLWRMNSKRRRSMMSKY
jgi:hypothetical protein